jgi:Carboxypeptidase regulatory-like domain
LLVVRGIPKRGASDRLHGFPNLFSIGIKSEFLHRTTEPRETGLAASPQCPANRQSQGKVNRTLKSGGAMEHPYIFQEGNRSARKAARNSDVHGDALVLQSRNSPTTQIARVFTLIAFLGLAIGSVNARAQSGAGSIQGTVTDSTGAVIQGATVHVVNQATAVASGTQSNDAGFYQVPGLFTGTYVVSYTAPGMKTNTQTLELLVGQIAVINPVMSPGAVSQQINVSSDIVQLTDTENGAINSTLENQRINQLPMNGRALLTLAANTVPGLENGDNDVGMEPQGFEYVADGVSLNNDNFGGQNNAYGSFLPDADAIQEVTFSLIDAPAQYASPGTAVITTKSGTNQLHGSAFETAVNNYWGVARTRNNLSNYVEPQYIRNEFGASVGGPIVLPHIYHGKNKSFWFFAYERYSLASAAAQTQSVPTMAERGGDFSNMVSSGVQQAIYDPSTTAASANCQLPPSVNTGTLTAAQLAADQNIPWCRTQYNYQGNLNTINPALESEGAKLVYAITPQPNNTNDPLVLPNLNAPNFTYNYIPTITWRLDHDFSEANKVYLRYQQNVASQRSLRNFGGNQQATLYSNQSLTGVAFPAGASGYQIIPISNFAPALGYTHVFSPTFYSETVLSQQWSMQYVGGGGNPNLDYDTMLGLPNNFGESGFPVINGLTTMNYGGTMYQYQENQIVSQIDENLTRIIGKHQLNFGGRIRHDRFYYLNSRNADTNTFTTYTTGLFQGTTYNPVSGGTPGSWSNTGLADAGLFLGNVASSSVQLQDPPTWFRDEEFDAYIQDDWHASRNLTVNIGLRYEAHPARVTRGGVIDSFDLKAYNPTTGVHGAIVLGAPISQLIAEGWTTPAIITNMTNLGAVFETAQQAGFPSALYDSANLEVSPRVGLAWQPFGNGRGTVLRGAYGRYIIPVPTRNANPGPIGLPFAYGYTQNYNAANQSPDGLANYPLREVGDSSNPNWIVMGENASNIVNTTTTTAILPGIAPLSPGYMNPDFKPSQMTEVGTTLEQPLKWNSALRVSWVWTHGSYLDHDYNPNAPLSPFDWMMVNGTAVPQGGASVIGTAQQDTYAATALGPYDNLVYGNFSYDERTGWSNDNELQVNYQHLFHHGYAFQIFYDFNRAFRIGENGSRDSTTTTSQDYFGVLPVTGSYTSAYPVSPPALPPARPTGVPSYMDWHALDKFENYQLDSGFPPHHIVFNYIFDVPVGRGKRFLGSANHFVDELVGGYQIAGVGHMTSSIFQVGSSNWGPNSPIHVYKHKLPIMDCTSGNCYPEYMWFNGYIPPTQNASSGQCTTANGVKTGSGGLECIYGLPSTYTPYQQPIDTAYGTAYYNTNDVTMNLANGSTVSSVQFNETSGTAPTGTNRYAHTFLQGPKNWESDLSLFKVFPVTERVNVRFNVDAFNFLNHQGWNNPVTTSSVAVSGIEEWWPGGQSGATSANSGRQIQLTLRLTF